eukprot:5948350-Karenia_brevis.AAC.1
MAVSRGRGAQDWMHGWLCCCVLTLCPSNPVWKNTVSAAPPIAQLLQHREHTAVSRGRGAQDWMHGRLCC